MDDSRDPSDLEDSDCDMDVTLSDHDTSSERSVPPDPSHEGPRGGGDRVDYLLENDGVGFEGAVVMGGGTESDNLTAAAVQSNAEAVLSPAVTYVTSNFYYAFTHPCLIHSAQILEPSRPPLKLKIGRAALLTVPVHAHGTPNLVMAGVTDSESSKMARSSKRARPCQVSNAENSGDEGETAGGAGWGQSECTGCGKYARAGAAGSVKCSVRGCETVWVSIFISFATNVIYSCILPQFHLTITCIGLDMVPKTWKCESCKASAGRGAKRARK